MPLDPLLRAMFDADADAPPLRSLGATQARANSRAYSLSRPVAHYGPEDGLDVRTESIRGPAGQIALRIYAPRAEGVRPVVVFFHGGGWVVGDLDTHDWHARAIAFGADAIVVSVDYRLAPEHPYPAPLMDAAAATWWAQENAAELGGSGATAVAGDSAGAGLAAAVTLLQRETARPPLAAQLLMYPAVDLTLAQPSVEENATGYGLTADNMRWYAEQYVADADARRDPLASPLLADDVSHTPPAVVVTAWFDVLRDEGDRYADRLRVAGVPVQHRSYPTLAHSFLAAAATVPAARAATEETLALFRAVLHPDRLLSS